MLTKVFPIKNTANGYSIRIIEAERSPVDGKITYETKSLNRMDNPEYIQLTNLNVTISIKDSRETIFNPSYGGISWEQDIPDNAIVTSTRIYFTQRPFRQGGGNGGQPVYSGDIRIAYNKGKFVPGYDFSFSDLTNYVHVPVRTEKEFYMEINEDLKGSILLRGLETESFIVNKNTQMNGVGIISFEENHLWIILNNRMHLKPLRVEVEYELPPPSKPRSLYPDGDTLNPRGDIRFSWAKEDEQEHINLQYSTNQGSTWTTLTNQKTRDNFFIVPGGTIKHIGRVDWRIRIGNEAQIYSDWTTAIFTAGAEEPQAPYLVTPVGDYILKSDGSIVFKWIYKGDIGTNQAAYEISISNDNGVSWQSRTLSSPSQQHSQYLDYTGSVLWKIRTKNNYNEWSPWSDIAQFTIIDTPPAPWFTYIENKHMPTLYWNSSNQDVYRIWIKDDKRELVFDTDEVADANSRKLKLPIFLSFGKYTFYIQIKNNFNIESPISEQTKWINPTPPKKPEIDVYSQDYRVVITASVVNGLVYRNNQYIGTLKDGKFLDYTAGNKTIYEYFVRNVEYDNYNDSEIKQGQCNFRKNTIATIDNPEDFIEVYVNLDNFPQKTFDFRLDYKSMNFAGRTYKATEFGESIQEDRSFTFYVEEKEPILKLIKKKKELIYRDINGEVIYGTIASISGEKRLDGYTVVFTIGRTRE
ncbi:hypothetical protein EV204_11246 [Tissierella praeacuta]|uniref:glycoside hydrolase family 78 protein n=1 Tax=Tissierella praeacuta TaxID=43131 RepID=UPI00104B0766|nr:hypothetical protein [Tissierella praeacuta]TCU67495.1 hypothetical protein EV204_11246 [Tissierella praeacuta]